MATMSHHDFPGDIESRKAIITWTVGTDLKNQQLGNIAGAVQAVQFVGRIHPCPNSKQRRDTKQAWCCPGYSPRHKIRNYARRLAVIAYDAYTVTKGAARSCCIATSLAHTTELAT